MKSDNEIDHHEEEQNCSKMQVKLKAMELTMAQAMFMNMAIERLILITGDIELGKSLARKILESTVEIGGRPFDSAAKLKEFDDIEAKSLIENQGPAS